MNVACAEYIASGGASILKVTVRTNAFILNTQTNETHAQGIISYILTSVFCSMASLRCEIELAIAQAYSPEIWTHCHRFWLRWTRKSHHFRRLAARKTCCNCLASRRCGARRISSFGKIDTKESPLRCCAARASGSGTDAEPLWLPSRSITARACGQATLTPY